MRSWPLLSFLVAAFTLAGCGGGPTDAPKTFKVTGMVTLDGQPVESGSIVFVPSDLKGRPDAGEIVAGKYEFECTKGEKRVEITATKEVPATEPEGMPDYISLIPARYNTASTLGATFTGTATNDVGGETFDFELTSK